MVLLSVREIHAVKTLNSELRSNSQLSACILYGTGTSYSSQGGLDGVNAFHCRSCYMYSGTGTYSTAVQVPVPQLYGFLTVYF